MAYLRSTRSDAGQSEINRLSSIKETFCASEMVPYEKVERRKVRLVQKYDVYFNR
jgi:hypothetical protein